MTKISRCGVWIVLYKCPSSNCEENKVVRERSVAGEEMLHKLCRNLIDLQVLQLGHFFQLLSPLMNHSPC